MALVPEDEAVPGGLTARQLVHYMADLRQGRPIATHPSVRCARSTCSTWPIGRWARSARACANGRRSPRRSVSDPGVLVLDEPLNGADPVQRLHLIALFKQLGADGRTVIVSSHVLNEVERLAERVIVLVHGRLAAAGGHRAIRDAMDDTPRHVLVRCDDSRRLAGALVGLESVTGVTLRVEARRAHRADAAGARAGHRAAATGEGGVDPVARSAPARRLVGEPVPGAGAMSAATSQHLRRQAVAPAAAPARHPRLHVAVVLPARSGGPQSSCRAPAPCCSGCSPERGRATAGRRVRERRCRGHLRAGHADRRAGHRRLRARCRDPCRFVPLHLAVARAHVADRARALGRRLDRRAGHDRARRPRSPRSSPAARPARGPAFVAAAVGSVAYVAVFIAIGCLTRRTAVWSLAFVFLVERLLGAALTGIAQLSPTWESRAIFVGLLDDPPSASAPRRHPRRRRSHRPPADRHGRAAADRQLAHAPPPPLRRRRLTVRFSVWSV